jgi:glycosyltransferase involved in cell wall biosynthesis
MRSKSYYRSFHCRGRAPRLLSPMRTATMKSVSAALASFSGSNTPRLCVVIPSYNTAGYIVETLNSVLSQTYTNYEIVVVNDCSPDTPELERVLTPFMERIRYIKREKNGGLAAARNTALRATTADLIALLDSDDIWPPDSLSVQVKYLQQHPELDLVYGDGVFFGGEAEGRRFSEFYPSSGEVTFESVVARRCNVFISVVAKREPIVKVGLFDENLRRCEDFELWCRLLKAGYRIGYHRNVIMRYRRHSQSLSANELAMLNTIVEVHEHFRNHLSLSDAERMTVDAQIRRYRAKALLCEGKTAFINADFRGSVEKITAANAVLQRPRLKIITGLIHMCPQLLHWIYRKRLNKYAAQIRNAAR